MNDTTPMSDDRHDDEPSPRRRRRLRVVLLVVALLAVAGGLLAWQLWPETETRRSDFDTDSITLAEWCAPDDQGQYPTGLKAGDNGETADYVWAEGGGCVHRSIDDAWRVLHDIPYLVGHDAGRIDRYEVEVVEPDSDSILHEYEILYGVDDLVTVEWTMAWTHELVAGTAEAPERLLIRYRRVSGSRFMPYWEGSMMLERVTDDVTAVFIHDEIKTIRSTPESSAEAVGRFFDKFVNGSPRMTASR